MPPGPSIKGFHKWLAARGQVPLVSHKIVGQQPNPEAQPSAPARKPARPRSRAAKKTRVPPPNDSTSGDPAEEEFPEAVEWSFAAIERATSEEDSAEGEFPEAVEWSFAAIERSTSEEFPEAVEWSFAAIEGSSSEEGQLHTNITNSEDVASTPKRLEVPKKRKAVEMADLGEEVTRQKRAKGTRCPEIYQ